MKSLWVSPNWRYNNDKMKKCLKNLTNKPFHVATIKLDDLRRHGNGSKHAVTIVKWSWMKEQRWQAAWNRRKTAVFLVKVQSPHRPPACVDDGRHMKTCCLYWGDAVSAADSYKNWATGQNNLMWLCAHILKQSRSSGDWSGHTCSH